MLKVFKIIRVKETQHIKSIAGSCKRLSVLKLKVFEDDNADDASDDEVADADVKIIHLIFFFEKHTSQ